MDLTRIQAIQDKKDLAQKEKQEKLSREVSDLKLQETIVRTAKMLVEFMQGHTSKTVLLNQIEDFATSQDAEKLVSSINSLHDTLKTHENTDISPLTEVMRSVLDQVSKIPKDHAKQAEQKFVDYTKQIDSLTKAVQLVDKSIKAQELHVEAPIVNVEAPNVQVDAPDLKPLSKDLEKAFKSAIGLIVIPEPEKIKPVVDELKTQTTILKDIRDVAGTGGSSGSASIAPFLNEAGQLPVATSPLSGYLIADEEETATYAYTGFETSSGGWCIQRETLASGAYRYAAGSSNYSTAWTNRASQTYQYPSQTF